MAAPQRLRKFFLAAHGAAPQQQINNLGTSVARNRLPHLFSSGAHTRIDFMPKKRGVQAKGPGWLGKHSLVIFLVLLALASARIVTTYTVFNHTVDEPAHIACGMEWLDRGAYHYESQHPPLARVMTAILPRYIAKAHSWDRPEMFNEGAAVLYTGNDYDRTLALARL